MRTNTVEILAYRGLLRLVLDWRGLDGDGITDPLRTQIRATLVYYAPRKQDAGHIHDAVIVARVLEASTEHPDRPDAP